MRARVTAGVLMLVVAGCASTQPEQDKLNDLETRIARLERIAANEAEVSQRLDAEQNDLRDLRGRLDELEHNNEKLTRQERDLYGDLDKRIAAMGGPASGAAAGTASGTAAGAAGAAAAGAAAGTAAASGPSSTEQAVYNQAFDALKAGSYSTAITGFRDFLKTYPDSSLADNAQYWLGEAYYVNHDYDSATGAFRTVLKKWPDSRKAPDAMLKLGFAQYEQKQYGPARSTLQEVTQKYPGTDSAKLASERLKRIPAQ